MRVTLDSPMKASWYVRVLELDARGLAKVRYELRTGTSRKGKVLGKIEAWGTEESFLTASLAMVKEKALEKGYAA